MAGCFPTPLSFCWDHWLWTTIVCILSLPEYYDVVELECDYYCSEVLKSPSLSAICFIPLKLGIWDDPKMSTQKSKLHPEAIFTAREEKSLIFAFLIQRRTKLYNFFWVLGGSRNKLTFLSWYARLFNKPLHTSSSYRATLTLIWKSSPIITFFS